jgi:hypothetical protein
MQGLRFDTNAKRDMFETIDKDKSGFVDMAEWTSMFLSLVEDEEGE